MARDGSGDGGRRSILVAEDEDAVRELVVEVLRDAGYDVVAVSTGEAALLRLVEHDDVSVLLTDIRRSTAGGWPIAPRRAGPTCASST